MSSDLPRTFKLTTVWLLIGLGVFLAVQWQQQQAAQTRFRSFDGAIEIRRGSDGHYHWPGSVNGRAVDFLVDTGATSTAISEALASELGLEPFGSVQSNTAGGVVTGRRVRADIALRGGAGAERLPVVALRGLGRNPLLGMDLLGRLRWQQRDGVLRIETGAAR
jgi:aspartyl protease family protein